MSKYKSEEYTRKVDYEIREITREQATDLVQANHYSPVMPTLTKHWLGIFRDNSLVGVTTLGWGTQPKHTIQKIVSKDLDSKDYYEIGKMCLLESEMKNSETQMISQVIEWLRNRNEARNREIILENKEIKKSNWLNKDNPDWQVVSEVPLNPEVKFLYTLADGIMGKCGYVYQAANFYYGGEYWTDSYMSAKGEKVHPRTTRQLCFDNWNWHYDENSPGFSQEFKDAYDKKSEEKRESFKFALHQALESLPDDELDFGKMGVAFKFGSDYYKGRESYEEAYSDFVKSGKSFGYRPREEDYMPKIPTGLSKYLPNPRKDAVKKQQVFWLTPSFMKHVGLRKIGGKMFRYIYPLTRDAKKMLKKSEVDWKIGSGVYPKEEDLKWKELVSKGKSVMLDGIPNWDLSVVEYNKKNVNAHKKGKISI